MTSPSVPKPIHSGLRTRRVPRSEAAATTRKAVPAASRLGAKVSKKELALNPKVGDAIQMDMTIWDIMGSKGFRELLREAYFHGAQGILAVADITRYDTLEDLDSWVESVFRTVGEIPVAFAIN